MVKVECLKCRIFEGFCSTKIAVISHLLEPPSLNDYKLQLMAQMDSTIVGHGIKYYRNIDIQLTKNYDSLHNG